MKFSKLVLGLLFMWFVGSIKAQQNIDSIFSVAIEYARSNKFNDAISQAKQALKADELRGDIHVFIANVYSWKEQNDSAMKYLNDARKLKYVNDEFYEASLNVLLRAQKTDSLLHLCTEAEKQGYKNKTDLVKKRSIVYETQMEYAKIMEQFKDSAAKSMLADTLLAQIYENAKNQISEQLIGADYSVDFFSTGQLQHYASVFFTTKYDKLSSTFALNYANRFGLNDLQIDYSGYKKLRSKNYWYLNYAYAFNGNLFAKHRVGLEYYFISKKKTEISLGGRSLFYPFAIDKNIWIATGSLNLSIKNSLLSIRPFFVMRNGQTSLSFSAKYRMYGTNPLAYTGFEFGFGNSPDDLYTSTSGSFNQLMSYRFRADKSLVLSKQSQLLLAASVIQEQFSIGPDISSRFRFVIDLGYRYRFK